MSFNLYPQLEDKSILLVDDEDFVREAAQRFLESYHAKVEAVSDKNKALPLLESQSFDVIILDLNMPGGGGLEIYEHVRSTDKETPVVLCTGDFVNFDSSKFSADSKFVYIKKPYEPEEFLATISRLLE